MHQRPQFTPCQFASPSQVKAIPVSTDSEKPRPRYIT